MSSNDKNTAVLQTKPWVLICLSLIIIGLGAFIVGLMGRHPERAWQAYLINFLLWSGIAQGGLLFSVVMHTVKARWSGPLSNLAESFTAFFPISFGLFLILFLGRNDLFPWLHQDLHGKEVWLNIPFLFTRDSVGLLILYGLGFLYLYHAFWLKLDRSISSGRIRTFLYKRWDQRIPDAQTCNHRMTVFGILYILAFAIILSLIGYDLVMSMDPHWYSTLFGAYTFVKAFYVGLGGLIILASALHLYPEIEFNLKPSDFHDIGKLFFAFCLVWADFFYVQLVVIWYGNIPEETSFIIQRVMLLPWRGLAWTVFGLAFLLPFLVLLNRRIKTRPLLMIILCSIVIFGIWLENLLLLGPALNPAANSLPLGFWDGLISLGFFGLMAMALTGFFALFPPLADAKEGN